MFLLIVYCERLIVYCLLFRVSNFGLMIWKLGFVGGLPGFGVLGSGCTGLGETGRERERAREKEWGREGEEERERESESVECKRARE